jgi:enamine deaminase RidA (YjgF/YER057c/UK114 family)
MTAPESLPAPIAIDGWPQPRGYSDAVVAKGRLVVLSGQIGWDPVTHRIDTGDFAEQTAQALRNIVAALAAAGAEPRHLVRLTWYVTSREEYLAARKRVGEAYREVIGRHFPSMSVLVVAGLLEAGAKVEIEATAVIGDGEPEKVEMRR